MSAGLAPECFKRTSVELHIAVTEVRGLNLVGPLAPIPPTYRGNRTGLGSESPGRVVLSSSQDVSGSHPVSSFVNQRAQTWSQRTAVLKGFLYYCCYSPSC